MTDKAPDRLYIDKDKNDRDVYDSLQDEIFKTPDLKERKPQFLLAMAVGYRHGTRTPLSSKLGFFRTEYLQPEDWSLLNAVAIGATGDLTVLGDPAEVLKIAEEYAHAGLEILKSAVDSVQRGTYLKVLEQETQDLARTALRK